VTCVRNLMRCMGLRPSTRATHHGARTHPDAFPAWWTSRRSRRIRFGATDIYLISITEGLPSTWLGRCGSVSPNVLELKTFNRLDMEFCLEALEIASYRWRSPQIFHSDQGVSSPPVTSWARLKTGGRSRSSCLVEGAATTNPGGGDYWRTTSNMRRCTCAPTAMAGKAEISFVPIPMEGYCAHVMTP